MRREGLTPDKVTFNTAIAAVASSGQCRMAFTLLAEMEKEGLKPDQVCTRPVFECALYQGACAAHCALVVPRSDG